MDISSYIRNNFLAIKVIPNSGRIELKCTEFSIRSKTSGEQLLPVAGENSGTRRAKPFCAERLCLSCTPKEPPRAERASPPSMTGGGRFLFEEENRKLKLYLKAPPDKNKANMELIKFFKKEYSFAVEIKSGAASREKVLRIVR